MIGPGLPAEAPLSRRFSHASIAGVDAMHEIETAELSTWIRDLYAHEDLLRMGHNQRREDLNLGLGWIYYALARVVWPRRAVVIGSYRGFVPIVLGRALTDNHEPGEVIFIDPSMVDDFWRNAGAVDAWFARHGVTNVRHFLMTTQEFVASVSYSELIDIGLLFVDGYHSCEQARFDYRAFADRLAPRGIALFHDSMVSQRSSIYGADKAYDVDVRRFMEELATDPALQVFDLPYGTGLTLVRRRDCSEPMIKGRQERA